MLVHFLSRQVVQRLRQGKTVLPGALGRRLKAEPGSGLLTEMLGVHFSLVLLVWGGVGLVLLYLHGGRETALAGLGRLVDAGFDVAGFHIVPLRIVLGVMLATVLFGVARQLRGRLVSAKFIAANLEDGARESMATLVGYAGMVVAILAGLGVAGVDLTSLAIVAGALSVGIGFGLQNIVNNFISGLILLSERPVSRGDFVRVGDIEGEVRKIHIRATEIETMDRVSVIVPNSDLISSPLHNWRLRDPYIRIVIQVGVAYGSDVEKVRDILLELGKAHELTLPDGTPGVPDTHVVFTEFADSSLNFELRTFIRDVSKRVRVASDLRFAIDRAFRENRVTIPFPQRDVWLRKDVDD